MNEELYDKDPAPNAEDLERTIESVVGDDEALLRFYDKYKQRDYVRKLRTRTRILNIVIVTAGLALCIMGALLIEKSAYLTSREVAVSDLLKQRDSLQNVIRTLQKADSLK
jgi:hypothetical protein